MENVSRPLIALLVASVAFLAVWMLALKPSSSGRGSSAGSGYQSAIAKAHQAVATSDAASIAHGGTVVNPPRASTSTAPTTTAPAKGAPAAALRPTVKPADAAHAAAKPASVAHPAGRRAAVESTAQRVSVVTGALRHDKVIALLFYNAAAADDRAIKRELAAVPENGRKVVKLAVPLNELARYTAVTNQVPVNVSPTLVLIDRRHEASTIVGFADRFEIAQRVADALAVPAAAR